MRYTHTAVPTTTTKNAVTTTMVVEVPIDAFVVAVVAALSEAVADIIVEVEDTTADATVEDAITMEDATTIVTATTDANQRCNLTIPVPSMAFTNGANVFSTQSAMLMLHRMTTSKATIRTMCPHGLS